MVRRFIPILLIVAVLATSQSLLADKFYIAASPETDSVIFESAAKLEFVDGKTNNIIGVIEFDPNNTTAGCSGRLRVDARTIRTGIELRDEHMRDRHLETDKYPYIEFVPKTISGLPMQLTAGSKQTFEIGGDFTVHGVTKTITAPATVEMTETGSGKTMLVTATFNVKLDDYKISRPKMLLLKVAETINVIVRFEASTTNKPVEFGEK